MSVNEEILESVRRKEQLIARCARQRAQIAASFGALERPIAIADRVVGVARFFRAHPVLLVAAVAAIVASKRGTLLGLAARGLAAWRAWRTISVWAQRFGLEIPGGGRR